MVKVVFFLIVIFIMIFPVFISQNHYNSYNKNSEKKPLIEIVDGKFNIFNKNMLETNGSFKKADIYKNYYQVEKLYLNNLKRNEKYYVKWALKKGNIINAKKVKFINKDYILSARKIIYFESKNFIKGWNFNFSALNARGEGKYFQIDKNRNIFARKIIYYVKVKK